MNNKSIFSAFFLSLFLSQNITCGTLSIVKKEQEEIIPTHELTDHVLALQDDFTESQKLQRRVSTLLTARTHLLKEQTDFLTQRFLGHVPALTTRLATQLKDITQLYKDEPFTCQLEIVRSIVEFTWIIFCQEQERLGNEAWRENKVVKKYFQTVARKISRIINTELFKEVTLSEDRTFIVMCLKSYDLKNLPISKTTSGNIDSKNKNFNYLFNTIVSGIKIAS